MDENQGEKSTQHHTHMGEGDYRETNLNDQSTYIGNQYNYHQTSTTKPEKRDRTQQKLLHWVETEVEKRLQQSLHNRVYIVLDKEENSEQVQHPWEIDIKVGEQSSFRLPKDSSIEEIFDRSDIAGRLLILGVPGSGKTTMLLKLAEQLVKRAKANPEHPIPVLLNLSSWKEDKQSIKDWMVTDLKSKYGVRKDIAEQWIEEGVLLPLLDGLDELDAARQEKCVEKINEFLHPETWSRELVVCSRIEEYQYYPTNLKLNGSIILHSLTIEQIQDYILKTEGEELWNNINYDSYLIKLAQTPLLLNIIILSFKEISFEQWNQFQSSEERQSYLFDAYIRRMLKRPYRKKQKFYKYKNTIFWLGWLAKQLIQENQTEFLIEKMQPSWLENRWKKIISGLISGLIFGLIFGLISGLIFGLIYELISGLTYGLISGLISGLTSGLQGSEIDYKKIPNQGIWQSLKNMNILISITFLATLGFCLLLISASGKSVEVINILLGSFGFSLLFGVLGIGLPVIKHFSLRLVLWFNHYIPWNYARFLDYSTDRLFLQRVGGRYRFIHDLLRQHFANL
ncbi:NACHT domain-containing protein [Okeania sp. SIO1F9]|uniref:NACHT domain-containing protein n=1 Tax=Okeania sp. SIO1F9 TaxID=2607813 RepID=UPI00144CD89B|nr:NACHT domain-containing protein [Okeania sp. SIO1F9]NET79731.1 NACHT domain-containing protein [Okeania sp. SIO1F9]